MRRLSFILGIVALLFTACSDGKNDPTGNKNGKPDTARTDDPLLQADPEDQEVVLYPNGNKKLTGNYRNGERHGVWSSWYKDGSLKSELRFQDGKRHGFYKTWYKNGNIRYMGQYHHGERTGIWKYYDKNGELVETQKFDHTEREKEGEEE